jgi:hypothetical protein
MKCTLKYFILGAIAMPFIAKGQISNVQVAAEGEKIVITYDYALQEETIDDIIVTYTTGDNAEPKEAKQVTGDLHDIRPGSGKRIVWDPLAESGSFSAENLVVNLTGLRDQTKQAICNDNLHLANDYFNAKSYKMAVSYYEKMLDCSTCNCNVKDISFALAQVKVAKKRIANEEMKDKYFISYLFDSPSEVGAGNMHGLSAFLLRNKGVGYYASFRATKDFYSPQGNMRYYEPDEDGETVAALEESSSVPKKRTYSWLFSTGLTKKAFVSDYVNLFAFMGVGLGSNSSVRKYDVAEKGYSDERWISNGRQNLFLSPELGVIANVYDYFSVTAGVRYPLSLNEYDQVEAKTGLGFMLGAGIKLKSMERNSYRRANTYVAYILDIPDTYGPDKLKSTNIIGISAGTVAYNKMGAYISARINPLIFNAPTVGDMPENPVYTGVSDYANAFATVGFTWMYFYAGVGASYQTEYKKYAGGTDGIWHSSDAKLGALTEFGVNLRLFDHLLLRGGVTFPGFKMNSENNEFSIGSNKMYYSLGIGYVLPSAY